MLLLTMFASTFPSRIRINTITSAQIILSRMPPISIPIKSVSVDHDSVTSVGTFGFMTIVL
jgi:hypothetical protein